MKTRGREIKQAEYEHPHELIEELKCEVDKLQAENERLKNHPKCPTCKHCKDNCPNNRWILCRITGMNGRDVSHYRNYYCSKHTSLKTGETT